MSSKKRKEFSIEECINFCMDKAISDSKNKNIYKSIILKLMDLSMLRKQKENTMTISYLDNINTAGIRYEPQKPELTCKSTDSSEGFDQWTRQSF